MIDDLLYRLQGAESDAERAWLVLELSLNGLPVPVREAVWAAAIPHWFDAPFLAALLGETAYTQLEAVGGLSVLTELSFTEPFPGRGYNVHERSRNLLLERLWVNDQTRFGELMDKSFKHRING